jgi:hypothetical protein
MNNRLKLRFWLETGLALISCAVLLVTILRKDWLEIAYRVDPDGRSGSLEWLIVAVALATTISAITLAAREWRRRAALAP